MEHTPDKMKESDLQKKCLDYVKKMFPTIYTLKTVLTTKAGFPDTVLFYDGRAICVEFKSLAKRPRPLQIEVHRSLWESGIPTFVCDNFDDFKSIMSYVVHGVMPSDTYDRITYFQTDKMAEDEKVDF